MILTPVESKSLLDAYIKAGIIWFDEDQQRWIGVADTTLLVELGLTKQDVLVHLESHPRQRDW